MTTAAEKLAGLLCQPEDIDGFEVICICLLYTSDAADE